MYEDIHIHIYAFREGGYNEIARDEARIYTHEGGGAKL